MESLRVAPDSRPLEPADWAVLSALGVAYAWMVRRFWFVTDDAYISFRYAKNWAEGHGLRFNVGVDPPVEGYSNFLWVIVCGGVEWLGGSVELWPLLLSSACGAVLLVLVYATLRFRLALGLPVAAACTLVWALHPPVAVYATSGLASMPFALALFVAFERLILRREGMAPVGAAVAALAVALLRVEGVYWVLLLFALAAASRRAAGEPVRRPLGLALLLFGVGYGAYFAWRLSYYGAPFANTVYAKSGFSAAHLARGLDYVMLHLLTHLTPLLVLPASLFVWRRDRRAIGVPVMVMGCAFFGFAVAVSGDFMAMGRLLMPGWSFAVLLLGWMLADVFGARPARPVLAVALAVSLAGVGVLPAFDSHLVSRELRQGFHFRMNRSRVDFRSEYAMWAAQKRNAERLALRGRTLRCWLPPDADFVNGGIGATGYYSGLVIHDRNGLVDREVARTPHDGLRSPGHDRLVPIHFFLDRDPELLHAELTPPGEPAAVFATLMQWRRDLEFGLRLGERYVVDFRPVLEPQAEERFLVMWRRIPDGVPPERAWAAFERRAGALRAGRALRYPPLADASCATRHSPRLLSSQRPPS